MPRCHASRNALEIQLEVELSTGVTPKLSMSLKRHVYKYIHKSESKEANSVMDHTLDVPQLVTDAEDIGKQIQAAELIGPLVHTMDFVTATQRTYRCDHHKGEAGFARDGFTHFYPIKGSNIWNCSIEEFDKLQALRRVQKDPDNNGELKKFHGWTAFIQNKAPWIDLRKKLVASSGAEADIASLERDFQDRFKKKKKDIFSQAANPLGMGAFGLGGFSDDESSDSEGGKKPRSRSGSVTASDDDSYWSDS